MWIDSNVKKAIIDFNKTNEKYRITVKEYGENVEDYQTALTQFNADLTTSNCPDIISLSNVDFHMYVSKGILEDLYPYMEKSGIHKEDYLENIMKAYEEDGKLYGPLRKCLNLQRIRILRVYSLTEAEAVYSITVFTII